MTLTRRAAPVDAATPAACAHRAFARQASRTRRSTRRGEPMLPLLAAALLAQAHVHGSDAGAASGKDASVPMSQLPHALDPDAPKPEGTMTKLQAGGQPSEAYVARPQGKPRGA